MAFPVVSLAVAVAGVVVIGLLLVVINYEH